uniref:Arrestin_C domain-containing protein n=1 Tax=Ascaris lumbricoides TaxID=6252 RepID=A0A0M3IHF1_ASCLU
MVKLDRFDIEFNNAESAYFAGQEISGKVIIENSEPKKVNEILLELMGRARTYWTKHSGKSRKHWSQAEPYFCEQFNTCYTHKFITFEDGKEERILPEGHHEVPFSYTLPKTLPSSFEGEFGYVRYTCRAICERPWDFDIVSKRAFTVVGIEDINEDSKSLEPASACECNSSIRFCCRKQGSISAELSLDRTGFTPGEVICVNGKIHNDSQRTLKSSCLRLKQHVIYRAKTFSGSEHMKTSNKIVVKKEKGEIAPLSVFEWDREKIILPSVPPRAKTFSGSEHMKTSNKVVVKKEKGEIAPLSVFEWDREKIILPSVPPRLSKCKIIEITYSLELQTSNKIVVKKEKGEIAPLSVFEWDREKIILPSVPPRLSKCKIIEITYSLELQAENAVTAALPIHVGTIPLLSEVMARAKFSRAESNSHTSKQTDTPENESESVVHVTVTDERGQTINEPDVDDLSPETEALISSRKRVRMPSSILSELYPTLPSPYYKESHFGQVDITEDKESVQFGEKKFAPKYPFYTD